MKADAISMEWIGRALLSLVLVLPLGYFGGCFVPGVAAADDPPAAAPAAAPATAHHVPRHHAAAPSLEDRVALFARALDLDAKQQAGLRKVLEEQRAEVRRIWSDPSVPAPYRIHATQAANDRTEDRIRALLDDEQKKKYKPPRQPRDTAPDSTAPSVEDWMNATTPK